MSKIRLTGSTSGYTEIQASAVAGDNTLSLPTTTDGTLLAADSSGNVNLDSGTLYVDAVNNRVGVGTTSPSSTFHASASSGEAVIRVSNTGANSAWLVFSPGSAGGAFVHNENNTPTYFTTNGIVRATLDGSGNLGLGVASAGQKFVVEQSGTARVASFHSTNASFGEIIVFSQANRTASTAFHYYFAYNQSTADTEFRVDGQGTVFGDNNYVTGADYAEFFEWQDGNPASEDRRGYSVILDGNMIRFALDDEEPIGVISARPSVVGDSAWSRWSSKYLTDDFGSFVLDANGDRQLNPDYDPDQPYVPREDRPEWSCVGLMGKLRIRKGQPTGSRWIKMRDISATVEEWLVR